MIAGKHQKNTRRWNSYFNYIKVPHLSGFLKIPRFGGRETLNAIGLRRKRNTIYIIVTFLYFRLDSAPQPDYTPHHTTYKLN